MNKLGKSHICLTKNLDGIFDPNFNCTIFRRTAPELQRQGGLIDESRHIYNDWHGEYKSQQKKWVFPSGAQISFAAISSDADLGGWQGSQLTRVLIDEAGTEWQENQVLFLMSRMRSKSKIKPQMILTANPRHDSFLAEWTKYCQDPDTGVPVEGTENIIRWFVVIDSKVKWADSREECYELYGKPDNMIDITGMTEEEIKKVPADKMFMPKTFRFIPTGVFDNAYLLPPKNTSYLANLLAQSHVNQLIFLHGSWTAREQGSKIWRREWITIVDHPPTDAVVRVRAWDFAATEPTTTYNPDYSVGVKMSKDKFGTYYIEDVIRFQKTTDKVIKEVIATAISDGVEYTTVVIPQDVGAAGRTAYMTYARMLAESGVYCKKDAVTPQSGKLTRFKPFAALCESGNVKVVRGDWNKDFFDELENFIGERSRNSDKRKDDQADAAASAFNYLCKSVTIPAFTVPSLTQNSPVPRVI